MSQSPTSTHKTQNTVTPDTKANTLHSSASLSNTQHIASPSATRLSIDLTQEPESAITNSHSDHDRSDMHSSEVSNEVSVVDVYTPSPYFIPTRALVPVITKKATI